MFVAMGTQEAKAGGLQAYRQPGQQSRPDLKKRKRRIFSPLTVSAITKVHYFHILVNVALVMLVGVGRDLRTLARCI